MNTKDKDISARDFFSLNEILADLLNAVIFKQNLVNAQNLADLPLHTAITGKERLLETERDILKLLTLPDGSKIALGLEIQSRPDRDMALRLQGYDGAGYQRQLVEAREARKRRKKGDSKAALTEQFPAAAIVLYLGIKKPWNTARSIADRFNIPQPFASLFRLDHEFLLIDAGAVPEDAIERIQSDLRYIVRFIHSARYDNPFIPDATMELAYPVEFFRLLAALKGSKAERDQLEKYLQDPEERSIQEMIISFLTKEEQQKIKKETSEATHKQTMSLMEWLLEHHRYEDALAASRSVRVFERLNKEMEQNL